MVIGHNILILCLKNILIDKFNRVRHVHYCLLNVHYFR